ISAYGGLGQVEKARENAQLATRACDDVGNAYLKAYCLVEWGKIAMVTQRYAEAKSHFRAALEIREQFNDPEGIALALVQLAELARLQNEFVIARDFCEQSLSLYRDLNDQGGLAAAQRGLGQIALQLGRSQEAAMYFRNALITADAINFSSLVIAILLDIADLMMANCMRQRGCDILRFVHSHRAATNHQQQVANAMLDGDCGDQDRTETMDLPTLIILLRSELQDFAPLAQENGPIDPLTEREYEVLLLMAQGLSNPEIADELVVAVGTVKAHTNSIYSKLLVRNRVAAIEEARARGLLNR
ncbi:MAG: LuxR C-terminal-related transcriptional regulator, partial [Caldilineaceae bacterium]